MASASAASFAALVIQHPVRFHMREPAALGARNGRERADLVKRLGVNGLRRQLHRRAPEVFAVRKARMRADGHAVRQRQPHALAHGLRVARVKPAGDIGRANQRHQQRVVAAALAEIGIQINLHRSAAMPVVAGSARDRCALSAPLRWSTAQSEWARPDAAARGYSDRRR